MAKIEDSDLTQDPERLKGTQADLGGTGGNGGGGGDESNGGNDEEDDARSRSLKLGGGPNIGFLGKYARFLLEVREELRKVTWPTRRMVVIETIVVLVVLVFFTLLITGLDQVFAVVFNKLLFNK